MCKESAIARTANVIDMAFNFTAMARVLEKGSKKIITEQLAIALEGIEQAKDQKTFDTLHSNFCIWFQNNIRRSKINLGNASYGQGAKILDVVTKVYFYYCQFPDEDKFEYIVKLLHGAVDIPILNYIKKTNRNTKIVAKSIADIDKKTYEDLQGLMRTLKNRHDRSLTLVEYEDILRAELT